MGKLQNNLVVEIKEKEQKVVIMSIVNKDVLSAKLFETNFTEKVLTTTSMLNILKSALKQYFETHKNLNADAYFVLPNSFVNYSHEKLGAKEVIKNFFNLKNSNAITSNIKNILYHNSYITYSCINYKNEIIASLNKACTYFNLKFKGATFASCAKMLGFTNLTNNKKASIIADINAENSTFVAINKNKVYGFLEVSKGYNNLGTLQIKKYELFKKQFDEFYSSLNTINEKQNEIGTDSLQLDYDTQDNQKLNFDFFMKNIDYLNNFALKNSCSCAILNLSEEYSDFWQQYKTNYNITTLKNCLKSYGLLFKYLNLYGALFSINNFNALNLKQNKFNKIINVLKLKAGEVWFLIKYCFNKILKKLKQPKTVKISAVNET